jgi:hypothetical protein
MLARRIRRDVRERGRDLDGILDQYVYHALLELASPKRLILILDAIPSGTCASSNRRMTTLSTPPRDMPTLYNRGLSLR